MLSSNFARTVKNTHDVAHMLIVMCLLVSTGYYGYQ